MLMEKNVAVALTDVESLRFHLLIHNLYASNNNRISTENMTDKERAIAHRWVLTGWFATITRVTDAAGLPLSQARQVLEGKVLFRVEFLPEIFRATGVASEVVNMRVLLHSECAFRDSILEHNRSAVESFVASDVTSRELFDDEKDLKYIIDCGSTPIDDEYKLED